MMKAYAAWLIVIIASNDISFYHVIISLIICEEMSSKWW